MSEPKLEANFSTLVLSIASAANQSLGLIPHPETQETRVDLMMARFNIDLLIDLQKKTKGNLNAEESQTLDSLINYLQLNYVQINK